MLSRGLPCETGLVDGLVEGLVGVGREPFCNTQQLASGHGPS